MHYANLSPRHLALNARLEQIAQQNYFFTHFIISRKLSSILNLCTIEWKCLSGSLSLCLCVSGALRHNSLGAKVMMQSDKLWSWTERLASSHNVRVMAERGFYGELLMFEPRPVNIRMTWAAKEQDNNVLHHGHCYCCSYLTLEYLLYT